MDKTAKLIRALEREFRRPIPCCDLLALLRSDFDRIVAKYAPKPAKRIPAVRKKPRVRKTVVRLRGKAMGELREQRWALDRGCCVDCFRPIYLERQLGHPDRMELSHIKSRGAGGSDTLANTVSRCTGCHQKSHNAGGKPCPSKLKAEYEAREGSQ